MSIYLARTWWLTLMLRAWAFAAKLLYRAISFEMDVMKTAGRTRAIEVNASREVRHESPAAVKGKPYFEDGTHQSASQHISSKPSKTWKKGGNFVKFKMFVWITTFGHVNKDIRAFNWGTIQPFTSKCFLDAVMQVLKLQKKNPRVF